MTVPKDLTETELQAAFALVRKRLVNDPLGKPLDGHERICGCADCSEVRDAALRQFEQLMENQCLSYVIQIASALDALCKTALMRRVSASPSLNLVDLSQPIHDHTSVWGDMSEYMAHPDTIEVTWRKVQSVIHRQIKKGA